MDKQTQSYKQIAALPEAAHFLRVLDKWRACAEKPLLRPLDTMLLPNLLWVGQSGIRQTELVRLLSDYVYETGHLMEFYGDVRFFEFKLDYCAPPMHFGEISRLMNEVAFAAGYRDVYRGVVSIDVSEWLGHSDEAHFLRFLTYLADNADHWLMIFHIRSEAGDQSDGDAQIGAMEQVLSMFFRLERSELILPATSVLTDFVRERLAAYGLTLREDAVSLLSRTIDTLRKNPHFDGYRTLTRLCTDMVYEICSADTEATATVSADRLSKFGPESSYIACVARTCAQRTRIGF